MSFMPSLFILLLYSYLFILEVINSFCPVSNVTPIRSQSPSSFPSNQSPTVDSNLLNYDYVFSVAPGSIDHFGALPSPLLLSP